MNIRKIARAAAVRIAALMGILIGITLFINLSWFDEELHPDLVALNTPRDVPMEGNAYPLFRGFLAAADRDPREAGLEIIRTMQERSRAGEPATLTNDEVDEILGHPDPAEVWQGVLPSTVCGVRMGDGLDCLDRVVTEEADPDLDDPRLRLLLDRFEQLLQEPRWEEIQELDFNSLTTPEPGSALTAISRIRLGNSIRTNTTSRFLQDIGGDIRFWRRILDGGQLLMSSMMALGRLQVDAQFLSTLMRTRQLSADELRSLSTVLAPLTESERNIEEVFMGELRFSRMSRMAIMDGWVPVLQLAVQRNATANEFYMTKFLPVRLRASMSAADFYRQRAYEPLNDEFRFMPPPLYNLGGKLFLLRLMGYGTSMPNYISRVHDLDGRIALVLLQAEIALHPDRSVQDVVNESRYRNPYTGEPMDYDSEQGTISFPCLARGRDECAVKL